MSDNKHTYTVGPVLADILASTTRTLNGIDYTVDFASVPDATIVYLVQNGWSQAIGDSQATGAKGLVAAAVKDQIIDLSKEEIASLGDSTKALDAWKATHPQGAEFAAWAQVFLEEKAAAKAADILSGDLVFGTAERLSPEEKDRRDITMTMLKAAAAANGMKLPKAAEELSALRAFTYETEQAAIDKEVQRRAKVRAGGDTGGLAAALAAKLKG